MDHPRIEAGGNVGPVNAALTPRYAGLGTFARLPRIEDVSKTFDTAAVLHELGAFLARQPEVTDYQAYAGTASPINFNGLVRQYYLRAGGEVGDIQVNLVDKHLRHEQSHAIVTRALEILHNLDHRGAVGADQQRGRGVGQLHQRTGALGHLR